MCLHTVWMSLKQFELHNGGWQQVFGVGALWWDCTEISTHSTIQSTSSTEATGQWVLIITALLDQSMCVQGIAVLLWRRPIPHAAFAHFCSSAKSKDWQEHSKGMAALHKSQVCCTLIVSGRVFWCGWCHIHVLLFDKLPFNNFEEDLNCSSDTGKKPCTVCSCSCAALLLWWTKANYGLLNKMWNIKIITQLVHSFFLWMTNHYRIHLFSG